MVVMKDATKGTYKFGNRDLYFLAVVVNAPIPFLTLVVESLCSVTNHLGHLDSSLSLVQLHQ